MKTRNGLLLAAIVTASLVLANQAKAGDDDGIVASPKLREMLNAQKRVTATPESHDVGYTTVGSDGVAASPKLRTQLAAQQTVSVSNFGSSSAGKVKSISYSAVGEDGIAASPKLRSMMR
jgi:hypothetical protein